MVSWGSKGRDGIAFGARDGMGERTGEQMDPGPDGGWGRSLGGAAGAVLWGALVGGCVLVAGTAPPPAEAEAPRLDLPGERVGSVSPPDDGASEGGTACAATPGQALLDAVNAARRREGLPPLVVDLRLVEAARAHSLDMARRSFTGHRGSDGSEVHHRAERSGYDWLLIAENVASGQPTVADVMGSWMGSPGHRRNILSTEARHFGAAVERGARTGIPHWTQVFGNTDRPVRSPPGGCHP